VQRIVTTALVYFALVFGAGFLLGPIRVLWLEPRLGPFAATLCETPFLLAAIVLAARSAPRATGVNRGPIPMALVGLIALVFQQAADLAVGVLLRGVSVSKMLSHFATPEGAIYAVLLALFAAMPWLVRGFPAWPLIPRAPS
jgi:hypothetical protein